MRRHIGLSVTIALANDERCNKASNTGIDVNNRTAGKVENAVRTEEAAAPNPVSHWDIYDEEPQRQEDEHGRKLHAFSKRASNKCWRDDREGHLEDDEEIFRNGTRERVHRHAGEECLGETTNIRVHGAAIREGQRITRAHP